MPPQYADRVKPEEALTISAYGWVRAGGEPVGRPAEDLDEVRRLARDEDVFGASACGVWEGEVVLFCAVREG